jgi:hypothetical protein
MALRKLSATRAHVIYRLKDGSICPGGSTVSKVGEDQSFLIAWAWKLGLDKQDYKKVTEVAANIGSVAHFLIECWLKGDDPDLQEYSKVAIDGGTQVFEKFKTTWGKEGLEYVASELELVSENYKFGGTLDIVARDKDKELVLVDEKSSPSIYGSFYRQVAGYENLWNENNEEHIKRRVIFRHGKDNPKDTEVRWLDDLEKHWNVFQRQLDLYYAFRAINKK